MKQQPLRTCVIVDDEPTARYGLMSYVNKTPSIRCVGEFKDTFEFGHYLQESESPDIIFMDIQMPGMSGLDFIASTTVKSAVIIVTAYEQHALKGYELNVCDYLLKPVSYNRFKQALDKASQYVDYVKGEMCNDVVFVRADRMTHRICVDDIIYLEALENYVKISTTAERVVTRATMKELILSLPKGLFVQIHKSYAANIRRIKSVAKCFVVMENMIELPLSRSFRSNLIARISDYGSRKSK